MAGVLPPTGEWPRMPARCPVHPAGAAAVDEKTAARIVARPGSRFAYFTANSVRFMKILNA
ncbi:hypothetical protein BCO9919_03550 [Burkholderia cenocepacia]|uniref:Uncharacterized protein n=1 Tax=Burkholderia cenocepacia TaxID=95486 RepID=A0A6J5JCD6_9BURK|nr:hypothetical protein BCO9919_03550 [Burkholderia cenocepacia]